MAFRLFRGAAVAGSALVCLGLSAATVGCSNDNATVTGVCPVVDGKEQPCQVRLTVLHTGDVHSRLFPYDLLIAQVDSELGLGTVGTIQNTGGIARVSYVLGRERARSDRVLHLNSGDYFEGAPIFNFFNGQPEMQAASAIGTDVMVIGNHEFDHGAPNAARQIQQWADFPVLAANYKFTDPASPSSSTIGTLIKPFVVEEVEGLKVAVIGMGNLSSLGSVFNQPNSFSITPLNTVETAQFYIDLLRPYVDVIVMLTHLGLDDDELMVQGTTGIDIVAGGHNHIVVNPPQQLSDCSANPNSPGFVWAVDPNLKVDPTVPPPNDPMHPDPVNHPYEFQRPCVPRNVYIMQSGAFSKYVGRMDMVFSNDPAEVSPTGNPKDYDPVNGFELVSHQYQAFPITDAIPDDPSLDNLLEPYQQSLQAVKDLDVLIGFSPLGAKRTSAQLGDSPLGNLVATAMWLRLGVQTDFSLTNSTGIRTDLNPGPVDITEKFNIFPFDNTITKMELSGVEVRELFDFVARRGGGRGCESQAEIAGARVRLNCLTCNPKYRPDTGGTCKTDSDCSSGAVGACDVTTNTCFVTPCAEEIYIGHNGVFCAADQDCAPGKDPNQTLPGQCDLSAPIVPCASDGDCPNKAAGSCDTAAGVCNGTCQLPIATENLYELATNNYIAAGGSGYLVLQRNTTQLNTYINQRDALSDWIQQGKPCGYSAPLAAAGGDGLTPCSTDTDCANLNNGPFVCACQGHVMSNAAGGVEACTTTGQCDASLGRCVLQTCRDQVAQYHEQLCAGSPTMQACLTSLDGCTLGGEECKILACVDGTEGAVEDGRINIIQ
jgi:5'-nucleotidase/UDP-sugar diphosphatase